MQRKAIISLWAYCCSTQSVWNKAARCFFHVAAVWLHECAQTILLHDAQAGHIYRTVGPQSAVYSGLSLQPVLEKSLPVITLPRLKSVLKGIERKCFL